MFCGFFGIFCTKLSHLQIGAILFLSFWSVCLLFPFLSLLYWVNCLAIFWIRVKRADILPLFVILGENFQPFTIRQNISCRPVCRCSLWSWGCSLFLPFWVFLIINRGQIFTKILFYIDMNMWFFLFDQLIGWIRVDYFQMLSHPYNFGINLT